MTTILDVKDFDEENFSRIFVQHLNLPKGLGCGYIRNLNHSDFENVSFAGGEATVDDYGFFNINGRCLGWSSVLSDLIEHARRDGFLAYVVN